MALVYRDGRPYLYRTVRKDGRVTSEFRASGEAALLIDRIEAIERDAQDYQRWKERAEREEDRERQEELDELWPTCGPWRRRPWSRPAAIGTRASGGGAVESEVVTPLESSPEKPSIEARARKLVDLWAAEEAVGLTTGKNKKTAETVRDDLRAFARELSGPDPSPIEATLAETAALCWLALRVAQVNADASGLSLKQAAWWQRKVDHCHRRYLSTLKTLATVRKLGVPAIQLNIAREQVNVAGG
jgi:hypothetical protein